MIDIDITQDAAGGFDFDIENGDIKSVEGFDTAIKVSLFTDARAPEAKVTKPENRRGWMPNLASPVENREMGGLLWLTEQRRLTQDSLNEAVDYARKSLLWFVQDGLAKDVTVTGEIVPRQGISLTIVITTLDGRTDTHYVPLWEVTGVSS
jgi:phage gp46-like protein